MSVKIVCIFQGLGSEISEEVASCLESTLKQSPSQFAKLAYSLDLTLASKLLLLKDPCLLKRELFGLREIELTLTPKGSGLVKGESVSRYFAISNIHVKSIQNSLKVETDSSRAYARNISLIAMESFDSTNRELPQGIFIAPRTTKTGYLGDI